MKTIHNIQGNQLSNALSYGLHEHQHMVYILYMALQLEHGTHTKFCITRKTYICSPLTHVRKSSDHTYFQHTNFRNH